MSQSQLLTKLWIVIVDHGSVCGNSRTLLCSENNSFLTYKMIACGLDYQNYVLATQQDPRQQIVMNEAKKQLNKTKSLAPRLLYVIANNMVFT